MIQNLAVAKALAKAQLVISVDAARAPADLYKLPAYLLALLQADRASLETSNVETIDSEGERAGASAASRAALDQLESALRAGYAGIGALLSRTLSPAGISDAERLELYTSYGWAQGELGRFTDSRVLVLAELAVNGETSISNPAYRYSDALVDIIQDQLDILENQEPAATSGERQVAVNLRQSKLDLLETRLSRVRYHYCSASDQLDFTPELARIGFQPRRPRGAAKPATPPPPPPTP